MEFVGMSEDAAKLHQDIMDFKEESTSYGLQNIIIKIALQDLGIFIKDDRDCPLEAGLAAVGGRRRLLNIVSAGKGLNVSNRGQEAEPDQPLSINGHLVAIERAEAGLASLGMIDELYVFAVLNIKGLWKRT